LLKSIRNSNLMWKRSELFRDLNLMFWEIKKNIWKLSQSNWEKL